MQGVSIVEHDHRSLLPANSALEDVTCNNVIDQEIQQQLTLHRFQTVDPRDELGVYEEASLACHRVNSDERMARHYRVFAH
jgi:hypothetical protein